MKYSFILFLFLSFQFLTAQTAFTGKVIDVETGLPVDYVNIGIVDKAKGTVSENDGSFSLYLEDSDINNEDIIQFSRIGYKTIKFPTRAFLQKLKENASIAMEEAFYELDEIIVDNTNNQRNRMGYTSTSQRLFGFWNDSLALGGEHASKIRIKKGPFKLEDLSFNIITSISDSLLVRVNVYDMYNGLPGKNISNRNILHTIKEKRGRVIIDLSPYNIVVKDHFVVSLELLKVYGGKVGIAISAVDDGVKSYTRLLSQDKWRRIRKGTTIAFNLKVSKVEVEDNSLTLKGRLRERPEEISIVWDRSLSTEDRNLSKELKFLDAYLKNLGDVIVNFQAFGYSLDPKEQYKVVKGNWEKLKIDIQKIVYDGATNNRVLQQLETGEHTLLFSDGNRFQNDVNTDWQGTVFTINSKPNGNHKVLKSIAEDSEANYINLDKIDDMSLAVDYTKRYLVDNLEYSLARLAVEKAKEVRGHVSDFDTALAQATVSVKGTNRKVKTNKEGNFLIWAGVDDILEFSYPGRSTMEYVVNAGTSSLNVSMPLGLVMLDEVTVAKNMRLEELNTPLSENVTTNFGVIDAERTGFAVKQIKGEQLNLASQTITEALKGKFPGIRVFGEGTSARVMIRIGSRFFVAWDVDGILYSSNQPPLHISIDNIKSITIMPGMWSAARYGRMAAGGIIIVRTISQSFDDLRLAKNTLQARVFNTELYMGDALSKDNTILNQPKYIQWINGSESVTDAYNTYLEQRKRFKHQPYFFADVHSLFLDKWKAEETANKILSNIEEQFADDLGALRLLAYLYEERGLYSDALRIYSGIQQTNPSQAQSQRDLAQVYVKLKEYGKAWDVYSDYIKSREDDLGDEGIDRIVGDEALELLEKHADIIGVDTATYKFNAKKSDIRLVVEWNNPNTEFELQFVNPEKRQYTWKHSRESNQNLLTDEIVKGFFSNSFEIEDLGQTGEWLINIKYLGNSENTPCYLKATIKDGRNGTESVKVLKLSRKGMNEKFLSFSAKKNVTSK